MHKIGLKNSWVPSCCCDSRSLFSLGSIQRFHVRLLVVLAEGGGAGGRRLAPARGELVVVVCRCKRGGGRVGGCIILRLLLVRAGIRLVVACWFLHFLVRSRRLQQDAPQSATALRNHCLARSDQSLVFLLRSHRSLHLSQFHFQQRRDLNLRLPKFGGCFLRVVETLFLLQSTARRLKIANGFVDAALGRLQLAVPELPGRLQVEHREHAVGFHDTHCSG